MGDRMSYELVHNTTRRAPKVTVPDLPRAYRKPPKEDEPTVEDVLREFGDEVQRCCDTEDTIAEYSDRIREVLRDADATRERHGDADATENNRLRAENAELLKDLEAEHALAEQLGHHHEDAKAENAKLRELTKDMFNCIRHANEQDWFYFNREETGCGLLCTFNGEECGLLVLADRMRKLGIEVDA